MSQFNVLIIDERPMVVAGIKNALNSYNLSGKCFEIMVSCSFEKAVFMIQLMKDKEFIFDLIIMDVDLRMDIKMKNPFDLTFLVALKKLSKESKLITVLRSKDYYPIYKIHNQIKPDGFILETELEISTLFDLIKSVMNESVYYSQTILGMLMKNQSNSILLDDIDRELLYMLSKGIKTKDLTNFIPRSLSALEKRKQKIKDLLVLDNCSDEELIEEAAVLKLV